MNGFSTSPVIRNPGFELRSRSLDLPRASTARPKPSPGRGSTPADTDSGSTDARPSSLIVSITTITSGCETQEFLKLDLRKFITKAKINFNRYAQVHANVFKETRGLARRIVQSGSRSILARGLQYVRKQVLFLIFWMETFLI